ncbi:dihydrofolate reductase [Luteimonas aestuarii]|uniref:Dihydrofolate reductase n=1 Tax=Luteimonas aestuarii TaxID=453837 RepID=A0A4R5TQ58_9GAMM|nr:dihydrofolate reductase [Luteimonas aestuarii]TDK21711.1 dihydrofolate reductase [Luteimonas aestuarii]
MRVSLVAALDRSRAIGRDNDLPWRLPNDLKRFKALTLGKPILMGRKTAQSLGRALPGRLNLVLTRTGQVPFDGMRAVSSMDEALQVAAGEGGVELSVVGGAEIYALALPFAVAMHLTWVDMLVDDADVFFPAFDAAHWLEVAREEHAADARHACSYAFVDYLRVDVMDGVGQPVPR